MALRVRTTVSGASGSRPDTKAQSRKAQRVGEPQPRLAIHSISLARASRGGANFHAERLGGLESWRHPNAPEQRVKCLRRHCRHGSIAGHPQNRSICRVGNLHHAGNLRRWPGRPNNLSQKKDPARVGERGPGSWASGRARKSRSIARLTASFR
jgi:hypothetical protein